MQNPRLRSAIYRMMADMIKLDNIISTREIDIMDKIVERYSITEYDMKIASYMKLSEAVHVVKESGEKISKDIYSNLYSCARSDEYCTREEALYLNAVKQCFSSEGDSCRIVSVPAEGVTIMNDKIVYVSKEEKISHPVLSDEEKASELDNITRLAGFELVYLPEIGARYTSAQNRPILRKVLPIISPGIQPEKVEDDIERLASITPGWFLRNVLQKRYGISDEFPHPCWLTRIHNDTVEGKPTANFLIVDTAKDIKAQIKGFAGDVALFQNSFSIQVNSNQFQADSFHYSGIMRSIIEMMAITSDKRWEIIIRTLGCKEFTSAGSENLRTAITIRKDDCEWPLVQGDRDASFYALILMGTAESGGVHFGRGDIATDDIIQRRYEMIYNCMRTGMDSPIVSFYKTRNPIKSRLIKTIREDEHLQENELYQINESSGTLWIPLDKSNVKVRYREGGRTREVPLLDSPLYAEYLAMAVK